MSSSLVLKFTAHSFRIFRFHKSHLYIIDVSQSVEHDHPAAFDFLRTDIKNVDEFWARRGARTLGLRRTFDFVVAENVPKKEDGAHETDESLREALTALINAKQATSEQELEDAALRNASILGTTADEKQKKASASTVLSRADIQRLDEDRAKLVATGHDEQLEDAVFMRSYIPRNLNEVFDPERDVAKIRRGEGNELIYGGITGVVEANATGSNAAHDLAVSWSVQTNEGVVDGDGGGSEDVESEDTSDDDEDDEENGTFQKRAPRGHRHEDKDAKKVSSLMCQMFV